MEKLCAFTNFVLSDCQKKLAEKILAYQVPAKIQYHALLCFLPFFFQFLLLSYEILNLIQPVNYV